MDAPNELKVEESLFAMMMVKCSEAKLCDAHPDSSHFQLPGCGATDAEWPLMLVYIEISFFRQFDHPASSLGTSTQLLSSLEIMSKVFRIVGISGSLRKESWNTKLLKAFAVAANDAEFVKKGVHFEIADWSKYFPSLHDLTNDRLPVYNGDLEADVPAPVLEFKKTIAAADGIIIVTPEYNYSYIDSFDLFDG